MGLHVDRKFGQTATIELPDGSKILVECMAPETEMSDVTLNVFAAPNVLIYRTEKPRTMDDRLRERPRAVCSTFDEMPEPE